MSTEENKREGCVSICSMEINTIITVLLLNELKWFWMLFMECRLFFCRSLTSFMWNRDGWGGGALGCKKEWLCQDSTLHNNWANKATQTEDHLIIKTTYFQSCFLVLVFHRPGKKSTCHKPGQAKTSNFLMYFFLTFNISPVSRTSKYFRILQHYFNSIMRPHYY